MNDVKVIEAHIARSLPVIDQAMDNTALATYMECPQKYDYAMRRHFRRAGKPSPAIAYGSVWHHIMETHYKTNGDVWAAKNYAAEKWEQHGKPDDHRTLDRALVEYDNYRARWGQIPELEDAQTLGWPDQPMVELSVNASWEGALYPYAGKIDRLIEWNGQLYVEDHKTTSRMGDYYFAQFDLDNQMMGYAWLAKQLTGRWIAGVRINAHAIYKRESKFERQVISFSDARLVDWAQNYNEWIRRIEHSYEHNLWPRNFKACAGKYGMCPYSADVCSLDPDIRERSLANSFDVIPWNPLATGELDAEE